VFSAATPASAQSIDELEFAQQLNALAEVEDGL
jgi:hypothetical protein